MEQSYGYNRQNNLAVNNHIRKKVKRRRKLVVYFVLFVSGFFLGMLFKTSTVNQVEDLKLSTHVESLHTVVSPSTLSKNTANLSNLSQHEDTGVQSEQPSEKTQDWALILVNQWNPLPNDYAITLTKLKNGHAVDERCYPDLQKMMDDCRAEGKSPLICSSYRTKEKQEQLFARKVKHYVNLGYSADDAKTEAAKSVAIPGTSEHHLGLAVDIVDIHNQNLNSSQEKTDVQQWLIKNSWKYGFILRYPSDKTDITGIIYEPWHYRYVGKDVAKEIHEQGICLEEYLDLLSSSTSETPSTRAVDDLVVS
ncbi:M15 family metallopeptidase [Oscillibacter sp.]|uniref:M15 family metallopeptidase n=1 Tax=Oscillibacter sp. TaxID=1945593 RepID=UPI0028AFB5D2|nr:M15 family metallopeptidase [Oscillibacter sp.]